MKMAPAKKREKDAAAITTGSQNTSNNVGGGMTVDSGNIGMPATTNMCPGGDTGSVASSNGDTSKLNGHQQEQELFLQAFEKPTQIYRFLRNRHGTSPIFLNRTLSYMKDRMSRNNKQRVTFKVNCILDSVVQKSEAITNNFINIIYSGLFEKGGDEDHWWQAGDAVCVEATLYKVTKNKRKDSTADFQEMLTQNSTVVYNPHEAIGHYATISIPVQAMRPLGDQHTIYKLLFRIRVTPNFQIVKANDNDAVETGIVPAEMACKRSKINDKTYGCELLVFEKNTGWIPEGDYEAALHELNPNIVKSFSPKKRSWETLPDNYIPLSIKFDAFKQFPTLKFRLTWTSHELPSTIASKEYSAYGGFANIGRNGDLPIKEDSETGVDCIDSSMNTPASHINHNNNCVKSNGRKIAEKVQIVYNFLYSNNTRQQTEYTQEVICPWCGLDCLRLYALLKHLKLCHGRFNFTYQPAGNGGARIDVTINDAYDGSYAGSPYDLAGPSGCSFARTCGPVRRTSMTNLLVCRPRRQKTCLDEFLVLDEDELSNQRPYITGHNRLYHHTETCLPVHPKELDIDSEGESDPLWLRQKTIQMIDEFSDVNEGEKELMKLWNLHVMRHGFVGDCQLPLACEMFLDAKGHEIIQKNLYRNFILHMCSLFDYGLIASETVYKAVQKLQGMLSRYAEGQELMSRQREAQLNYWLTVGMHKERDEQKFKSPVKQASAGNNNAHDFSATDNRATHIVSGNNDSGGGPMNPPLKRSAMTVKRSSILSQNGNGMGTTSSSSEKINSCPSAYGKSVAKKTALQAESGERDRERVSRRHSVGANIATSTDGLRAPQASKKRLLSKDAEDDDEDGDDIDMVTAETGSALDDAKRCDDDNIVELSNLPFIISNDSNNDNVEDVAARGVICDGDEAIVHQDDDIVNGSVKLKDGDDVDMMFSTESMNIVTETKLCSPSYAIDGPTTSTTPMSTSSSSKRQRTSDNRTSPALHNQLGGATTSSKFGSITTRFITRRQSTAGIITGSEMTTRERTAAANISQGHSNGRLTLRTRLSAPAPRTDRR